MGKIDIIEANLNRYTIGYKNRTRFPPGDFWDKISHSHQILVSCREGIKSLDSERKKKVESEIEKNFIINLCTALEVFFKDTAKALCDNKKVDINKLNELLKHEVSLKDAYNFFNKRKRPTLGDLISQTSSFQSLENIGNTFNKLTDSDFFREIENLEIPVYLLPTPNEESSKITSLKKEFPKWREILNKIFTKRHEFVHEYNPNDTEFYSEVRTNLVTLLQLFIDSIENHLNLSELTKPKIKRKVS